MGTKTKHEKYDYNKYGEIRRPRNQWVGVTEAHSKHKIRTLAFFHPDRLVCEFSSIPSTGCSSTRTNSSGQLLNGTQRKHELFIFVRSSVVARDRSCGHRLISTANAGRAISQWLVSFIFRLFCGHSASINLVHCECSQQHQQHAR